MSNEFEVGTYIDLRYINKRAVPAVQKKTIKEHVFTAIKVSEERYIFKAQTSIPVAFA